MSIFLKGGNSPFSCPAISSITVDEEDADQINVDCNELIYELFGEDQPEDQLFEKES